MQLGLLAVASANSGCLQTILLETQEVAVCERPEQARAEELHEGLQTAVRRSEATQPCDLTVVPVLGGLEVDVRVVLSKAREEATFVCRAPTVCVRQFSDQAVADIANGCSGTPGSCQLAVACRLIIAPGGFGARGRISDARGEQQATT